MAPVIRRVTIIGLALVLLLAPAAAAPAAAAPLPQSAPCAVAAAAALSARGAPYVWGAKGPGSFDCSGLTSWAWGQAGYNIGLGTYDQMRAGVYIPCTLADIDGTDTTCWEPGDLIFLRYAGGQHVAMYIGRGLVADAYNSATGVIVHDPSIDTFYQANFSRGRRIVDCDGVTVDPGTADPVALAGGALEYIPDLLAPVSFAVQQCGECNPDGSVILPPTTWSESWPSGWELFDLPRVVRLSISWLAWQIGEIIRNLICWLISLLAQLAGVLQFATNSLIAGLNGLWRLFVFSWLSAQAWFLALWAMFESIRALVAGAALPVAELIDLLADLLAVIWSGVLLVVEIFGAVFGLIGSLTLALLGLIGYLGGLGLGMIGAISTALASTTVPAELVNTHPIYYGVRGIGEGVLATWWAYAIYLAWAMAWVGFIIWLWKFFGGDNA